MCTLPDGSQGWVSMGFFEKSSKSSAQGDSGLRAAARNTGTTVQTRDNLSKAWNAESEEAMKKLGFKQCTWGGGATRTRVSRKTAAARVVCKACGEPIVGKVFSSGGDSWHHGCFSCVKCALPIAETAEQSFVMRGGEQIWCKKCDRWDKKIDPTATRARKAAGPTVDTDAAQRNAEIRRRNEQTEQRNRAKLEAQDRAGQGKTQCFKCGLDIIGPGVQDGSRCYHPACWTCAACGKAIGSGTFVRSNGNPFHPQCLRKASGKCGKCGKDIAGKYFNYNGMKIHKRCFVCDGCGNSLTGGFVERAGGLFCVNCREVTQTRTTIRSKHGGIRYNHWKGRAETSSEYKKTVATRTAPMRASVSAPAASGVSPGHKFCTQCGQKVSGAKFCPSCGAKQ